MTDVSVKVSNIQKLDVQADNSTILDVALQVYDGDKLLETRKLGFPLGTTVEDLKAEVDKFRANYNNERAQAEQNAERDAEHATADKTIEEAVGYVAGDSVPTEAQPTGEATAETVADAIPQDVQPEPATPEPNTPEGGQQ
jgi:hypothetical protein